MESLVLPLIYMLILAALVLTYCGLRLLKNIKHMDQQPDPSTRRGRIVSFLREIPNYRPPGQRHSQPNNASDYVVQTQTPVIPPCTNHSNATLERSPSMVLQIESLAADLALVHNPTTRVNGMYTKCDLSCTYPPHALGTASPWPGAFGTMIDREFGQSQHSEDSGIFSSGPNRLSSMESLPSNQSHL